MRMERDLGMPGKTRRRLGADGGGSGRAVSDRASIPDGW